MATNATVLEPMKFLVHSPKAGKRMRLARRRRQSHLRAHDLKRSDQRILPGDWRSPRSHVSALQIHEFLPEVGPRQDRAAQACGRTGGAVELTPILNSASRGGGSDGGA